MSLPPLTRQLTSHLDSYLDEQTGEKDTHASKVPRKSQIKPNGKHSVVHPCDPSRYRFLFGEATNIGGGQTNQDKSFVEELGDVLIMAVFDGHGRELGEDAAIIARDLTREMLRKEGALECVLDDPESCLADIFIACHQEIKSQFKSKYENEGWSVQETEENYLIKKRGAGSWACIHGGTTATVVIVRGDRVIVANVGDSTALFGSKLASGAVVYHELSAEHSPESIDEFKRIREFMSDHTGTIPEMKFVYDSPSFSKNKCPPVFRVDPNDSNIVQVTGSGSYYKNVRNEWASLVTTPPRARFQDALAFTRSLGDLHLHVYGVSEMPQVREFSLAELNDTNQGVCCFLVCTDGVWDNWKYHDVVEETLKRPLVDVALDLNEGTSSCEAFMKTNLSLARTNFGNHADNMTAILCYIVLSDSK